MLISYAPQLLMALHIYKKQDYANVERGLYVKIIHVNYNMFANGL